MHNPNIIKADKQVWLVRVFGNEVRVIYRCSIVAVKVNASREVWNFAISCLDSCWDTFESVVRQHLDIEARPFEIV